MKAKKSAKKKGPKGKKARAKAKLDRQWGEVVDEKQLEESRVRRGKSRLLREDKAETTKSKDWKSQALSHDVAPMQACSSGESDDEEVEQNGALSQLLQSIDRKSRKTKRKQNQMDKDSSDRISRSDDEQRSTEEDSDTDISLDNEQKYSPDDVVDSVQSDFEDEPEEEMILGDEDFENGSSEVDPFSSHFNRVPLPEETDELAQVMAASQQTTKVPLSFLNHSLDVQLPSSLADKLQPKRNGKQSSAELDQKLTDFALSLFSCNRKVLKQEWKHKNSSVTRNDPDGTDKSGRKKLPLSSLQCALYPSLATYADILITAESRENRNAVNNLMYLHVLNHVLTSRSRIQRNNKKAKEAEQVEEEGGEGIDTEKLRDQGFTRPSILILLPTRGTCHTFVNGMMAMLGDSARVDNMDRFEAEYGIPVDEDDDDTDAEKLRRRKIVVEAKGSEWQELFGDETNDDDDFKIGITVTPKAAGLSKKKGQGEGSVSVKLYSDFYRSDIIIASPLGLKMSTDSEDGDPDVDFLSSIEICLVAHAAVLLMQNWDHVNGVLDLLNKQPIKNNDTDFARVRSYLLAGHAEHWRQLIVSSSLSDPHIMSSFKRHAKSIAGRLKVRRRTQVEDASLCNVMIPVKQIFQRIPCSSFASQGSDRLRFFEEKILPRIRQQKQKHTMIFIPSYFDFVSVRNLLLKKEVEFVSVTEYARVSEVSRGRARFLQGLKPLLLYTGRAHFFSRHVIKGVRHLILYGVPEHSEFYSGLVNMLNTGLDGKGDMDAPTSCLALFTKFDALALERIVGSEHCNRMIKGEKVTYMFCS